MTVPSEEVDLVFAQGLAFQTSGHFAEAIQCFGLVLQRSPAHVGALINIGAALYALQRYDDALRAAEAALSMHPDNAIAHNNRGNALNCLRRYAEAVQAYDRAIGLESQVAGIHANRGSALVAMGDYAGATSAFSMALKISPIQGLIRGLEWYARMHLARWSDWESRRQEIVTLIAGNQVATTPFAALAFMDDPALQLELARAWHSGHCRGIKPVTLGAPRASGRIHVAYFSSDFFDHATMRLAASVFELHDRSRFEVSAFAWGYVPDDAMRQRAIAAFDHFHDVDRLSDARIAELARHLHVDIAIDLKGYTRDARPAIFAHRAAPLQVSYLGYPGTTGAASMDYLVADRHVIAVGQEEFYSEQLVFLPDTYQPNQPWSAPQAQSRNRSDWGLPLNGVVFCCFNNVYKITPPMFAAWMDVLRQVPDSVLWLLQANGEAMDNLRSVANQAGIVSDRLVFAAHVPLEQHWGRLHCADLMLDTSPYTAHTTASDALRCGVPVITLAGKGFAARVAASLLHVVGLAELVASSVPDYVDLAVRLAGHPHQLLLLRQMLAARLPDSPLFDCKTYVRHLESGFETMVERARQGFMPTSFPVERMKKV